MMLDVFFNGLSIHVIFRLSIILILNNILLSNEYVVKSLIWKISRGHRNGKLSQTWETGKHNNVDVTIPPILYIFAYSLDPISIQTHMFIMFEMHKPGYLLQKKTS